MGITQKNTKFKNRMNTVSYVLVVLGSVADFSVTWSECSKWSVCRCPQPAGLTDRGSSLSAVLQLPGSPGLDSAAFRRAQRQTAHRELRRRSTQCKWRPTTVGRVDGPMDVTVLWLPAVFDSRFWGRTVCVLASAMEVCFLCLLTCSEPRRYSALTLWAHTTPHQPNTTLTLCYWPGFLFSWPLLRSTVWKTPECPNRLLSR